MLGSNRECSIFPVLSLDPVGFCLDLEGTVGTETSSSGSSLLCGPRSSCSSVVNGLSLLTGVTPNPTWGTAVTGLSRLRGKAEVGGSSLSSSCGSTVTRLIGLPELEEARGCSGISSGAVLLSSSSSLMGLRARFPVGTIRTPGRSLDLEPDPVDPLAPVPVDPLALVPVDPRALVPVDPLAVVPVNPLFPVPVVPLAPEAVVSLEPEPVIWPLKPVEPLDPDKGTLDLGPVRSKPSSSSSFTGPLIAAVGPGKSSGTIGLPLTLDSLEGGVLRPLGDDVGGAWVVLALPGVPVRKLVWKGSECSDTGAELRGSSPALVPVGLALSPLSDCDSGGLWGRRPLNREEPLLAVKSLGGCSEGVASGTRLRLLVGTGRSPAVPTGLTLTLEPVPVSSTVSIGIVGCWDLRGCLALGVVTLNSVRGVGELKLSGPGEDWTAERNRSLSDGTAGLPPKD